MIISGKYSNRGAWTEIGRTTLGSDGDGLDITTLPTYKYLRFETVALNSGQLNLNLNFNNDTGSNYSAFGDTDFAGAPSSQTSATGIGIDPGTPSQSQFIIIEIINISNQEKLGVMECFLSGGTGSANAPDYRKTIIKWANTSSQITRIDISNTGTGDIATGSEIIAYGHN